MKNSATENSKLHKIANKREEKLQIFALAKQKTTKTKGREKKQAEEVGGEGAGEECVCVSPRQTQQIY